VLSVNPISKSRGRFHSNIPEGAAIVPIMRRSPSKTTEGHYDWEGLGTGFIVSSRGLIVTARHVLIEHMDFTDGRGLEAWIRPADVVYPCPLFHVQVHPNSDLAIAKLAYPKDAPGFKFGVLPISLNPDTAEVGARVVTYGYPRTRLAQMDANEVSIEMVPDYYDGKILEYHGSGVSICKWPVYRHSVPTADGMSGGPLMLVGEKVAIGVNCTGDSTRDADVEHGMATDLRELLSMPLSMPIPEFHGKPLRDLLAAEAKISGR